MPKINPAPLAVLTKKYEKRFENQVGGKGNRFMPNDNQDFKEIDGLHGEGAPRRKEEVADFSSLSFMPPTRIWDWLLPANRGHHEPLSDNTN